MTVEDQKRALQELLDKRANLWQAEGQPLVDAAATRALSGEEETKMADIEAAFERLDRAIKQTRDNLAAEEQRAALGVGGQPQVRTSQVGEQIRSVLRRETPGVDLAFDTGTVTRALSSSTASDGAGNTIDSPLWSEFLIPLRDSSSILEAGARIIVTESGESIDIPYLKSFGEAESDTGESATMSGTDPEFGMVPWSTSKKDQVIYVPRELTEDSAIDIETLVGSLVGLNVGMKVGAAASASVAASAVAGVTGAATKFVPQSFDEIIDLEHSVPRVYRKGASFVANDSLTKSLRKIKDNNGQYMWQPATQLDEPDMLNGKPYITDAFLADPAADAVPMLFGNFKMGVWVRMVGSLRLERSDQAAWAKDQIGFKGVLRTGQAVVDANAVKAYKSGAAA